MNLKSDEEWDIHKVPPFKIITKEKKCLPDHRLNQVIKVNTNSNGTSQNCVLADRI